MEIPETIDAIMGYTIAHKLSLNENVGILTLQDKSTWTLEAGLNNGVTLTTDNRAIWFPNVDQLIGWLRCYRMEGK